MEKSFYLETKEENETKLLSIPRKHRAGAVALQGV